MEEHRRIVRQVLQILESNQLFLKPEKCEFEKDEVEYLGIRLQGWSTRYGPINSEVSRIGPLPQNSKMSAHSLVSQVSIVDSFETTPASLAPSMISLGRPPPGSGENRNRTPSIG